MRMIPDLHIVLVSDLPIDCKQPLKNEISSFVLSCFYEPFIQCDGVQKSKVSFYTLEWPSELQNLCHFLFHGTFNCTAYISMNGPSILEEGHWEHANGGAG